MNDLADPEATKAAIAEIIARETAEHWRPKFAAADCCVTIMASLEEALHDPHFVERGLFAHQVAGASGETMPALPVPIAATLRAKPGVEAVAEARRGQRSAEGLKRLAAHQPRLRGRLDALAHHGAAQRRDAVEQIEPEAARALHGQEIRQQAAIEHVDRDACGWSRRRGACRS